MGNLKNTRKPSSHLNLASRFPGKPLKHILSAVNFLKDVKTRFPTEDYNEFLTILATLKHGRATARQVSKRLKGAMRNHLDLLAKFHNMMKMLSAPNLSFNKEFGKRRLTANLSRPMY